MWMVAQAVAAHCVPECIAKRPQHGVCRAEQKAQRDSAKAADKEQRAKERTDQRRARGHPPFVPVSDLALFWSVPPLWCM